MNSGKVNLMHRSYVRIALLLALTVLCWLPAAPAAAQPIGDVVTVGNVTATSALVDVPIYIRDVAGTPLGVDQPPGSKIQSYSIKVDYAPASAVSIASPGRAGITASLTPLSEFAPTSPGSASIIDVFEESTNPIPFVLNAPPPGNQVAHILFQLSPSVVPGSVIPLTLDPALTQLANDGGTTTETINNGGLVLVPGSITIPVNFVYQIPTLSHWALALLAMSLAFVAVRFRM